MQRRNFMKITPAVVVAGSLPLTAHAERIVDNDPVVLWSHGEELLKGFPEARVRVYKDGYQVGAVKYLDSRLRRMIHVPGPGEDPVETAYDVVTVSAPLDVLNALRDANVLPRHWVKIGEPCLRIVSRERVVIETTGQSIEKIAVSLPVPKEDMRTTPFGSDFFGNRGTWYMKEDGLFGREGGYSNHEERFSPDELLNGILDPEVNGWIELRWTDGIGHVFFILEEGETLEAQLSPTRPARVIDLTKQR